MKITQEFFDPVVELRKLIDSGEYNQSSLASELGVTSQFLSDVLNGRRGIGNQILDAMGWERVVLYRKSEE